MTKMEVVENIVIICATVGLAWILLTFGQPWGWALLLLAFMNMPRWSAK